MNRQQQHTSDDEQPNYLASVLGWLYPRHPETAREGAAGATLLAGVAAVAALAVVVAAARRSRKR